MKRVPFFDILVVTYNAKQTVDACLRAVIKHTRDLNYQVTVLDNASLDGTFEHLRIKYAGKIHLVQSERNLGFSGGVNRLLRQTQHPWVVLLDDDVEVSPGWLTKLYTTAIARPKVGVVGGKVVYPNGRIFCAEFSLMPFGSAGRGEMDRGQRNYVKEVDALPGPCWLLPRTVIEKVGPFDEDYFPSQCEDIDYCLRVRRAGYKIVYQGGLCLVHHNLFRCGSDDFLQVNYLFFFRKWKKKLGGFPTVTQNAADQQVFGGAHLFKQENFCPVHPVWGKIASLSPWFSEPFYRGVFWVAKNSDRAAEEFKKALKGVAALRASCGWQSVLFYQILASYYARMGRIVDARCCGEMAMSLSLREGVRSLTPVVKTIKKNMVLHDWTIYMGSDQTVYFDVLKKFLPYYPIKNCRERPLNRAAFEINRFQTKKKQGGLTFLGDEVVVCDAKNFGIYRTLEPRKKRISIYSKPRKKLDGNRVFHGEFLGPLSFLLRSQRASLVHGALVKKNNKGILILGEKGAGKSTLSAMCLKNGFSFLSDEHPILQMKGNDLIGKSFVNLIALPAISMKKNFSELEELTSWSFSREKYLLDPLKLWPKCRQRTTKIDVVLFPKFRLSGELVITRLDQEIFYRKILEDEYLKVILKHEIKTLEKSTPRKIASALAHTARGFSLEYGPEDIQQLPLRIERL